MTKNKWAIGAILGVVVGTIVGLLTAPKTGKKTRDILKKYTTKSIKNLKLSLKKKVK